MRKIITIGESTYQIHFSGNTPQSAFPGGVILNAAASLAMSGINTYMVSETACDFFGNQITDFLLSAGVDTKSLDRFTEGSTTLNISTSDGIMQYGTYPVDRFNVVWPRIDENDIVIFGGFYAVDAPQRDRLFEIVRYARERKAIIIYLPGFPHQPNLRITKVMTAILENLEMAHIVIASETHIKQIFGSDDCDKVFKSNIEFYCPNFLCLSAKQTTLFSCGKKETIDYTEGTGEEIASRAALTAGIAHSIVENDIITSNIAATQFETWRAIALSGTEFAANIDPATRIISSSFAQHKAQAIAPHLTPQE